MQNSKYDTINQELTNKARQDPKYQIFLNWLISNGSIIDPCIQYPVAFGPQGYIGVSTNRDIDSYEAIIAISKSLIIDIKTVLQNQQLRKLFSKNPYLFGQSDQQENNFNMLTLFLIYQKAKGQKSFYKPYFDAAQCQNLIVHWTQKDLEELENPQISKEIKKFQKEMKKQSQDFLNVILSDSNLFPNSIQVKTYLQYFQWGFEFIMTRAFGWTVPQSYLIPFADMLNHGQHSIDHCILDIEKQLSNNPKQNPDYISKLNKCNLSILKNAQISKISKKNIQIKRSVPTKRMKYILQHRQYLQDKMLQQNSSNSKELLYKIIHQTYKLKKKRFRQLYFDSSSCTQDNDTDGSDIITKEYNKQIIKINDKQIIKNKSKSLQSSLNDYWKTYSYKRITSILQNHGEDRMLVDLSENSEKSLSQHSDVSKQDQYQWINQSDISSIYFILYTTSKYQKGQQLYNFYGKRPNKFFVIGYNFALLNNKYDSFGFMLYFDNLQMKSQSSNIDITKFLLKTQNTVGITTQIRLKKSKVSTQLINHCRAIILSTFTNSQNIYGIPVTIPINKFLQQQVLEYCKQIIQYKLSEFKTTIADDYKILDDNTISCSLSTAVIVRLSYKLILNKQLEYLDLCLHLLRKWQNGSIQFDLEDMDKILATKDYLRILDRSCL